MRGKSFAKRSVAQASSLWGNRASGPVLVDGNQRARCPLAPQPRWLCYEPLHRSRGHNQFVTLQRRHFDVPPKIVGVDVLGRFPMKAFVETAIE